VHGAVPRAFTVAHEQVVLKANSDGADPVFYQVVFDHQAAIYSVDAKLLPVPHGIAQGVINRTLVTYSLHFLDDPGFELRQ